ncbi:MAG: MBL fold metallo-hydrolase [Bacteroidota bacterium]|nr:MBL fold metallo-hydrolase [Bacteroidota bacterium]
MNIEQIYTGCLAQGAYYITSNGEAAIIDPLREIQPYLNRAEKDGVKIKYIFETHFHADFVSGHLDLAKKTGAAIIYGPNAKPEFDFISAVDGQEFKVGDLSILALHTPGHTMESTTYLLRDKHGKDYCIFSGDTLFLGDVGRPDLSQKDSNLTTEDLAGFLYDSLQKKIMPLADDVIVYPAHGAGSACGKNMMKETIDTLGNQKKVNYALKQDSKDDFIKAVTEGLSAPPAYFSMNVSMNKKGYADFEIVLSHGMKSILVKEFGAIADSSGALILDTRSQANFAKGFIPQSINIGLDGDFAPWVGTLIADVNQAILLVTESGREEESVTRISRVGFDQVIGHLEGGFDAWKIAGYEIDKIEKISVDAFAKSILSDEYKVIDVRRDDEYNAGHVVNANSKPLANINDWIKEINPNEHFFIHCASGYRSMIAASILQARGYRNFTVIDGGYSAIKELTINH